MGCIILSVVSTVSADFVIGTSYTLSDFSSLLPLRDVVCGSFLRLYHTTFFYVSSQRVRRYVFIYGYSLKLRNNYAKKIRKSYTCNYCVNQRVMHQLAQIFVLLLFFVYGVLGFRVKSLIANSEFYRPKFPLVGRKKPLTRGTRSILPCAT